MKERDGEGRGDMGRLLAITATVGVLAVGAAPPQPTAPARPVGAARIAPARAAAPAAGPGRGAGACTPRWRIVPGPDTGTSYFAGVAAISPQAVWAAGSVGVGTAGQPLAARWDGRNWRVAGGALRAAHTSPFFGYGSGAALVAVAALTPRDVWAVGSTVTAAGARPLVAHWTGAAWRAVATPDPGADARLRAVAALSARDVWAVGDVRGRALIEHWDGRAWRIVATPPVGGRDVLLSGIAAPAAADIWAVGSRGSAGDSSRRGLIEHWDGARWRVTPSPQPGVIDDTLSGVAAGAADDVWAVGSVEGADYEDAPLVERWDGRAWRAVAAPALPPVQGSLDAVAVRSPRDVWAVGGGSLAHWTGTRWGTTTVRTSPYVSGVDFWDASTPYFAAVTATPSGGLWAVGRVTVNTDEQYTPLIAQYDAPPACR